MTLIANQLELLSLAQCQTYIQTSCFCKLQWLPDFSYLHHTMSVLAAVQSSSGGTWRVFNHAGHAERHCRHCLSAAHMLALPAATFVGRLIAGALLAMCMLQVLHEGELRLMTIAQLVNGTRESALLRVARLAKQFAQVTLVLAICPLWPLSGNLVLLPGFSLTML